jgi:ADP-ribose pyrophosphatase YjhB (NUDIX family)
MSDNHEQAIALIDGFAFELLVLAYEFDYYFPSLLTHPELLQTLEVTLPARAAAARVGLAQGTAGAPLQQFLEEQLQRLRASLEGALDISEVTEAFVSACDALYHWLRRYDCIDAECVDVSVIVFRGRAERELLVVLRGEHWGLPSGPQQAGESLHEAALHATEEETGVLLDEEDVYGVVAQSYDFDEQRCGLYLNVYLLVECPGQARPHPRSPARTQQACFTSWEQLQEAGSEFSPSPSMMAAPLSQGLLELMSSSFDLGAQAETV